MVNTIRCDQWLPTQAARRRAKLLKAAAPPPFTISPSSVELQPGGRVELQVTFQPANKHMEDKGAMGPATSLSLSEEAFGYVCQLRADGYVPQPPSTA